MPAADRFGSVALRPVWMVRILGFLIYAAAFFLPACRESVANGVRTPDTYKGWFCALITLTNSFSLKVWHSKDFLAVLSGWINPLILIYLVLLIWPKFVRQRRIVAAAIVAFMAGHLDLLRARAPGAADRPLPVDCWNPDDSLRRGLCP